MDDSSTHARKLTLQQQPANTRNGSEVSGQPTRRKGVAQLSKSITFQLIPEDLTTAIRKVEEEPSDCIFDCLVSTATKRFTRIEGVHCGYSTLSIPREDEDDEDDFIIDDDTEQLIKYFIHRDYPPIMAAIVKGHTVTLTPSP